MPLFATYIRNGELKDRVIYFGPMGCATGFYILVRNADNEKVLEEVKAVLNKIINHTGEVFGQSEIECGNYKMLSLETAVREAKKYLDVLNSKDNNFLYFEC